MRFRSLAAFSAAALTAVVLAGCSSPAPRPTTSASVAADLCSARVAPGAATAAVTVEGDPGTASTAVFTAPLAVDALQSQVVLEGTGPKLEAGTIAQFAYTAFDATTGEELGAAGYAAGELLPQPITAETTLGKLFGCAPVGSRVVAALPATQTGANPSLYVLDILGTVPAAAWGTPQDPTPGLPTVSLAENGAPTITVPGGEAPADVRVSTLKKGDGVTVEPGDEVLAQYTGALWTDGTVFDSSWSRGAPATFSTTGVVEGFGQALEGQTVGSQVLVVIPPAFGYGDTPPDGSSIPPGATLVFVIDILGSHHLS